ncbi:MAG: hypothetical protein WBM97_05800 [Sedimenticolaceae bacterium]
MIVLRITSRHAAAYSWMGKTLLNIFELRQPFMPLVTIPTG